MARAHHLRAKELRILNAIAEALNSAPDVREALERTLALVAELLGLPTGWVWLLDAQTGEFYSAAARNLPPYLQDPVQMTGRACWCIDLFRKGELAPKNVNVLECSRLCGAVTARDAAATQGLRFHASLPLHFGDKPLGIMNVTGPAWRELQPRELRLLATIAHQVGGAVERARLAEEAARLARFEERARLAREIHDTLAQGLTGIALQIEAALPHLDSDPGRARVRLERALAAARESLEEARRSVLDLRAEPLAGRPLLEALQTLARRFASETGIRVRVRAAGQELASALPLRVEAELYRIAGEALANVRRHAGARDVTLLLQLKAGAARLFIRDNGCGFVAGTPAAGHGILGMKERARLLGGHLELRSRPGRGTTVSVEVPVECGMRIAERGMSGSADSHSAIRNPQSAIDREATP